MKRTIKYAKYREVVEELNRLKLQAEKQKELLTQKTETITAQQTEINILRGRIDKEVYKKPLKRYVLDTLGDYLDAKEFVDNYYNPFYEVTIDQDEQGNYQLIKKAK